MIGLKSSDASLLGSGVSMKIGEEFREERLSELGPRLMPLRSRECSSVGLERPERAVTSASSLRRASSSRSNLQCKHRCQNQAIEYRAEAEYVLATEHLDVETSSVPDTHAKDKYKERATPEGAVV